MSSAGTPLRRTPRTPKPSMKAKELKYVTELKNARILQTDSDEDDTVTDEEVYLEMLKNAEKPQVLHEGESVYGDDMFKFQQRKSRGGMMEKAQKTPHVIRKTLKSKLSKITNYNSDSDDTFDEDDEEESSSDSDSDTSDDCVDTKVERLPEKDSNLKPRKILNKREYVMDTEQYFAQSQSKKVQTSGNTLDKLETPRLPQYELQKQLKRLELTEEHARAINKLNNANKRSFKKWLQLLHENYNILVYGLGSKRFVLNKFKDYLQGFPVIVINGFFPTLTLKNILDSIICDVLCLKDIPTNPSKALELIKEEFKKIPGAHLYLIVHNIEGENIRNSKCQNVLSELVTIKNIHLIASIDHINGPLIWDHKKLSKFKYIWWDCTTFAPYIEETSFEGSMMVQQSDVLALSSLRNVFLALTSNSKAIYMIIAKHQLNCAKDKYYQGMAFKDLYLACRESFVVSSDLTLRAQLTEFNDHKMVKIKRSVDGAEYLTIPLNNNLLRKFIDECSTDTTD